MKIKDTKDKKNRELYNFFHRRIQLNRIKLNYNNAWEKENVLIVQQFYFPFKNAFTDANFK